MLLTSLVCMGIQAHQVKQPWGELRLKFDLTPEEGTKGSNTLGTFSEYCFAHEGSSHQQRLSRAMRSCILKEKLSAEQERAKHVSKCRHKGVKLFIPSLGLWNGITEN